MADTWDMPERTQEAKIRVLEQRHSDCEEACQHFDQLLAVLRGEDEPAWWVHHRRYGCEEPPVYGRETLLEAMLREYGTDAYYAAMMRWGNTGKLGLSAWLPEHVPLDVPA